MARLFTIVTYVIRNAGTPEFNTPNKMPVDPNSDFVKNAPPKSVIFTLFGNIRKGAAIKNAVVPRLPITAEKYRDPNFDIVIDDATGTITVKMIEFAKGRGNKVRRIEKTSKSVVALNDFFSKKRAAIAQAEAEAAKAAAIAAKASVKK